MRAVHYPFLIGPPFVMHKKKCKTMDYSEHVLFNCSI